jgi:hypothetical protein
LPGAEHFQQIACKSLIAVSRGQVLQHPRCNWWWFSPSHPITHFAAIINLVLAAI